MLTFFDTNPDHPMYDLAEARRLFAELQHGEPRKALDNITFWLDSIKDTSGFRHETRTPIVMLMEPGSCVPDNTCQAMMGEKSRDLKSTSLIAKGEDYGQVGVEWLTRNDA